MKLKVITMLHIYPPMNERACEVYQQNTLVAYSIRERTSRLLIIPGYGVDIVHKPALPYSVVITNAITECILCARHHAGDSIKHLINSHDNPLQWTLSCPFYRWGSSLSINNLSKVTQSVSGWTNVVILYPQALLTLAPRAEKNWLLALTGWRRGGQALSRQHYRLW